MWNQLKTTFRMFLYVWSTLPRLHRMALTSASLITIGSGILTNVPPLILGKLVDTLTKGSNASFRVCVNFVIILALVILVKEGLQVLRKYLVENACTQIEKQSTLALTSRILKLDLEGINSDMQSGALSGRIHRSIEGLLKLLKASFLDFIPISLTVLCSFVIVLFKSPSLSVLMCLVVPFGFFVVLRQLYTQSGIRLKLMRTKEEIDGKLVELLQGVEFVRAASTEAYEAKKMEAIAESLRKTEIKHDFRMAIYDAAKYLNEGLFFVLTVVCSVYMVSLKLITAGDILVYALLFNNIVGPLREMHRTVDVAHEGALHVADFINLMQKPLADSYAVKIGKSVSDQHGKAPSLPHIETVGLSFKYRGSNGKGAALRDINLAISKGQRIGIAGPSGSGKSTLIKLLLRLYEPCAGSIVIGGRPLSSMTREEIAATFGYVSQTPFLFSGTIEENIAYGCGNVSHAQAVAAANKANIHDEIARLDKGYQSVVTERGENLSGGQRQRIAIARVFLKNPQVLLFDEATAALDHTNEKIVQDALLEAMKGRTVIMVAHRLSTLRYADRIIVFGNGAVSEIGGFEELLERGGAFARLHDRL